MIFFSLCELTPSIIITLSISFKIDGLDKFVSSYYQLRYNDERYNQEIEGGPLYGAWVQSIGGNIQMDNNENMGNTNDIHSNIMDQLK